MLEIGAAVPDAISKLSDATNSFYNVVQASPTNALGARAWGRIGDCCLLASSKEPGYREHARIAYEKSINIPGPMPVALKSQTRLGLAKVLVQQAAGSDGGEKKITKAIDHLLAVIHGRHLQPGQVQDVYWRAQCCLMAMDLFGQLGKPREALEICNLMKREFPAMQSGLEKRKQQLLDQLTKIK